MDDNGDYCKGMIQFGEDVYYFDEETGVMLTSCWVKINEVMMLYFDDDGKLVLYKLIADDGTWYYLKANGEMAAGEYWRGYWLKEKGVATC